MKSISIHAPTRGATSRIMSAYVLSNISIHAPTRGATRFNDLAVSSRYDISIHAPTRGATCDDVTALISGKISIHAPTRGATYLYQAQEVQRLFQSTLPREERLISAIVRAMSIKYFNPRSHERSDMHE